MGKTSEELCSMTDDDLHYWLETNEQWVPNLIKHIIARLPELWYNCSEARYEMTESKPKPKWRENLEKALKAYSLAESIVSLNGHNLSRLDEVSDEDLIWMHDHATPILQAYLGDYTITIPRNFLRTKGSDN